MMYPLEWLSVGGSFIRGTGHAIADSESVSYTHLDVYKRQIYDLTLRFANEVTDTELDALKENTAYALTTNLVLIAEGQGGKQRGELIPIG